jgi:hypothetical protein
MSRLKSFERRMLRPHVAHDGTSLGLSRYLSFADRMIPPWWRDHHAEVKGEVLGIYENHPGSPKLAVIFTTEGILVLGAGQPFVRYDDIAGYDPVNKAEDQAAAIARLKSGEKYEIPLMGGVVDVLAFLRFAYNAS